MLDRMRLRQSLLDQAGGPLKRLALRRLIGDLDARGIIRLLRARYRPKDVLVQQHKVARADALAFVAPVHFLSFPAILKGWLDRVWTPPRCHAHGERRIHAHLSGIKNVEREYFYAVHGADDATRRSYLERAYALGRQF